ncbi:hypothetical protein NDU88_001544 [Pleurodeles waltl]|uniref:Uncharacterized protein n=1 Tax=Pleurodeles waltl TaxID=8319 RepID=A0AAV7MLU5_PLEWA|nr:hypothetical protein NDU88_001544 [Pleurodeles waltl]
MLDSASSFSRSVKEQDGSPAALLEPPKEVRTGFPILPRVLEQARTDSQVWFEYVPPVFQAICQRYRLCEVGLS